MSSPPGRRTTIPTTSTSAGRTVSLAAGFLDSEYRIVLHHSVETEGSCSGSQLLQDGVQLFASCGDINLQSKEDCTGEDCSKQVKDYIYIL